MLGDLATEDDLWQNATESTTLSSIAVSIAVSVLAVWAFYLCLRGPWGSIQRRLNQGAHNRQLNVNPQLSVNHQPSSPNTTQAPENVGHVPSANHIVATTCPTFTDERGATVHKIPKPELQKYFQKRNFLPVETEVDPLDASSLKTYRTLDELKRNDEKVKPSSLKTYHTLDELKRNDMKFKLNQAARKLQSSGIPQPSVNHSSNLSNTIQARDSSVLKGSSFPVLLNLGQTPTAYDGDVTTCPTFRDGKGIVHGIRITELPKCFQKETVTSKDTLVDQLNRIKRLIGSDISTDLLPRSTNTCNPSSKTPPSGCQLVTKPKNGFACVPTNIGTLIDTAMNCSSPLEFRPGYGPGARWQKYFNASCDHKPSFFSPLTMQSLCSIKEEAVHWKSTYEKFSEAWDHLVVWLSGSISGNQDAAALLQDEINTEMDQTTPCYINEMGNVPFIVTEEPCPAELESFWNLTWEENVPVIVNLSERKNNSMTYIPLPTFEQCSHCGEVIFTLLKTTERPEYSVKEVKVLKGYVFRHIYICHFIVWPEDGIPDHPQSLISFIIKLKSLYQGHSGPLLVFCNEGLRRSASFVTIFTLIELLKTKKRISVQDFVVNLTLIHRDMVPNQDLYNFIFETLAAASIFPMEILSAQSLLGMNLSDNKYWTRMRKEYQALLHQQSFGTQVASREECATINVPENRFTDIEPLDLRRPVCELNDNAGASNYVITNLVDSFWSHNGIIITQSPLLNTIEDFWKMVLSYNCAAVVALDTFTDRDWHVPQYWLNASPDRHGNIIVEYPQCLSGRRGILEKRKICVRHEWFMTKLEIDHYFCLDWPTSNTTASLLIDVFVEIQPLLKEKKRIVLHCLDGVARSSIIAAVSMELGRVKEDGVVDLFQTVWKLRRRHPQVIKSEEDYDFCYTLLKAALKAWRTEF